MLIFPTRRGFTIVEVAVMILVFALLAALAIPRYMRFAARLKRAEAVTVLKRAHQAQTSYYSVHQRYLKICAVDFYCTTTDAETATINKLLGLSAELKTPGGYDYSWNYLEGERNYELRLTQDLVPNNGAV